ncbi:MAG: major facilitator superfamily 1, partial [Solirubrobacterales bacterium]|nr:major facilitator superfamily 1 [Solirubrobacterales bacterium]
MKLRTAAVTLAAGLGLADASIVTLALPQLLHDLSTTVQGVAAVLAVYTVVLAVALLPAEALARRIGPARAGAGGFALLAVASLVCGVSGSLPL